MDAPLTDRDRATVHEALDDIRADAPPDRTSTGCVVALPGFALLLVVPVAARVLAVGAGVATALLCVGIAFLVVGLVLWFSAGGQRRRHAAAASEAALRTLEGDEADREVLLRAATLLLVNARVPRGRAFVPTLDATRAGKRLGERAQLVDAVERLLVEEEVIYPVFADEDAPPAPD